MKKILGIFVIFSLLAFTGCEDIINEIIETDSESQIVTTNETFTTEYIEAETTTEEITTTETATAETSEIFNDYDENIDVQYSFRSKKLLEQHYEKHGSEFDETFGYETAEEYEQGASDVINNPDALYKTEKEDGDGVYYIEETNEFVILSTDGYIRTYFRPSAGIKYFERQ